MPLLLPLADACGRPCKYPIPNSAELVRFRFIRSGVLILGTGRLLLWYEKKKREGKTERKVGHIGLKLKDGRDDMSRPLGSEPVDKETKYQSI